MKHWTSKRIYQKDSARYGIRLSESRPALLLALAALLPALILSTPSGKIPGAILLILLLPILLIKERVRGLKFLLLAIFFLNFFRVSLLLPSGTVPTYLERAELRLGKTLWYSPAKESSAFVADLPGVGRVCLQGDAGLFAFERVRGKIRLSRTEGAANPGSFDEASWLAAYGVFYRAEIEDWEGLERGSRGAEQIRFKIWQRMQDLWQAKLGGDGAAFLQALLFGDKSALSEEQRSSIFLLGIEHITAVSGMHLIFLLAPFSLSRVQKHLSAKLRLFLQIALISLWSLLCGMPPGFLRASSLLILGEMKQFWRLRFDRFSLLCLSAFLMGIAEPFSLLNKGFLWSYAAAASLFILAPALAKEARLRFPHIPESAAEGFSSLIAAQSAMLFLNGERFTLLSPLMILMQLPAAAVCGLLFVLALPWVLLILVGIPTEILAAIPSVLLKTLSDLWQHWLIGVPRLRVLRAFDFAGGSLFALLFIWLLLPMLAPLRRVFRGRRQLFLQARMLLIGSLSLIILLKGFITFPCELIILSVGQGEAFVIRSGSDWILYDSGKAEICREVLLPFMAAEGISEFSAAILTHGHEDHAGGLVELLRYQRVREIYLPEWCVWAANDESVKKGVGKLRELLCLAKRNGVGLKIIRENDRILLDRKRMFSLEFIAGGNAPADPDQDCLISRLCFRERSILLTADMSAEQEEAYLKRKPDQIDVLKIAHHGSKTVTSEAFLDGIRPEIALLSVGRNHYGHPAECVLARLEERGIELFRTDRDGAIRICLAEDGNLRVRCWKSGRSMVLRE